MTTVDVSQLAAQPGALSSPDWDAILAELLSELKEWALTCLHELLQAVVEFATDADFGSWTPIVASVVLPLLAQVAQFLPDIEGD